MSSVRDYNRHHRSHRSGWLRAAVLGANDGIISTSSLMIGVASAAAGRSEVLLAGLAGLVAGAISMAAGEYVSVSSQSDTERADLELERHHLIHNREAEHQELVDIYRARGLDEALARQVATQLMEHDALDAHAREELGIHEATGARPVQAAWTSAVAFSGGALLPWIAALLAPDGWITIVVAACCIPSLALLGALSACAGGASPGAAVARVVLWGSAAMAITALVGQLFGVVAA